MAKDDVPQNVILSAKSKQIFDERIAAQKNSVTQPQ
jgi:hypothetical protein